MRIAVMYTFFILDLPGLFVNLQQMQRDVSKVSSSSYLLAELEKIASDKGFVISDNEGSGNCMFYALSEQLNLVKGIKISHGELRQSIVQYLRKNPKLVSLVFFVTHILVKIIFTCGLVYVFHMIRLQQLDVESDKVAENFALPYTGIVQLQKLSIPPPRMVIRFVPPPPPGISSLALYFPFKSSAIDIPHPLRTFDDLLLCGYGYFWIHTYMKAGLGKVLSSHTG